MNKDTVDCILDGFIDLKSRILEVADYWAETFCIGMLPSSATGAVSYDFDETYVIVRYYDYGFCQEEGDDIYSIFFHRELLWRDDWQERVNALKAEQDERERRLQEDRRLLRQVYVHPDSVAKRRTEMLNVREQLEQMKQHKVLTNSEQLVLTALEKCLGDESNGD
jgi:hypothetical protein